MNENSNLMVPELAEIEVGGLTRSAFLLKTTLAAGAVYGIGSIAPFVGSALASSKGDIEILNFALTLEVLESEFYKRAIRDVSDMSDAVREVAEQLLEDETAHVEGLTAAIEDLGGKPVKAPALVFGKSFDDEKTFLKTAVTLEDTGVSAYNGAAPMISDKKLLETAGAIVQIEGRHAALVRSLNGEGATLGAFDKTLDQKEVLKAVEPFIKA